MRASRIVAIAQTPTTVSHDARVRDIGGIVAQIPDPIATTPPTATQGEVALARLASLSAELRGGAIVDPAGEIIAANGDRERWSEAARAMLDAADAAAGEPVTQAHVGTEDGEVFVLRHRGYALVAAADRFALASLLFCDMRAVLRELLGSAVGSPAPATGD